ncbi:LrgB family protein [Myroides guanonis]|uniref:LrgB family protein n=1 Tax=Myroides guanonis TaxID=1150112 RepID=UPI00373FE13D
MTRTSSHALEAIKAMTLSQTYWTFSSVGMIFSSVLTAVLALLILEWLRHWF